MDTLVLVLLVMFVGSSVLRFVSQELGILEDMDPTNELTWPEWSQLSLATVGVVVLLAYVIWTANAWVASLRG